VDLTPIYKKRGVDKKNMSRPRVKDMPRNQQKCVMSKINPGPSQSKNYNIKPSYNIPKKSGSPKVENKEEDHETETD